MKQLKECLTQKPSLSSDCYVNKLLLVIFSLILCSQVFAVNNQNLVEFCLLEHDQIIRKTSHEKYGKDDPCKIKGSHAQALCQSVKLIALQRRLDQLRKQARKTMLNNPDAKVDAEIIESNNWKAKVRESCKVEEEAGGGPYNAWTPVNIMACEIQVTCQRLKRVEQYVKK